MIPNTNSKSITSSIKTTLIHWAKYPTPAGSIDGSIDRGTEVVLVTAGGLQGGGGGRRTVERNNNEKGYEGYLLYILDGEDGEDMGEGPWGVQAGEVDEGGVGFVRESSFKYAVLNGGLRLFVGKKFAYMQMKIVAVAMLLRFKVVVEEGQEVASKVTTTLYMKNGLRVKVESRKWK